MTVAFKTPTLRNGGLLTLAQVVDFYDRGGNVNNLDPHPDIGRIGFSAAEAADVVNFLETLTDDRVKYARARFDHPSLEVPHGHVGNSPAATPGNPLDPAWPG